MKWLTFRTQREPGFRLNLIDLLTLAVLVLGSSVWRHLFPYQHLYLLPLYVFVSFFLFCNVFHKRVSRSRGVRRYAAPLGWGLLMTLIFTGILDLVIGQPSVLRWISHFVADRSFIDGQARVWQVDQHGLTVVRLAGGFDLVYDSRRSSSLREIGESHGSDYVINGNGYFRRTLIGYTEEDRAIYFIATRQDATLGGIADALLGMRAFRDKTLTVVNLDGGISTALYSRNHPELNIPPLGKLPCFLVSRPIDGGGP